MPPAKRDPASILDAIIERAPKLHAAGITSVSASADGGFVVHLSAPTAPTTTIEWLDRKQWERESERAQKAEDEQPTEDASDPLNDRATYAGGRVPGFTRPKKEQQ